MDIYQFAMQMEKDGEIFYRQLAKECHEPGLVGIFTLLAAEEVTHYQAIKRLSKKENPSLPGESAILQNVKNIFVSMQAAKVELQMDTTKAAEMTSICNDEWCNVTESFIDDMHKSLYAISEPRWLSKEQSDRLKQLRKKVRDIYREFAQVKGGHA